MRCSGLEALTSWHLTIVGHLLALLFAIREVPTARQLGMTIEVSVRSSVPSHKCGLYFRLGHDEFDTEKLTASFNEPQIINNL